jgi:threonine dehydrogenase-like Zn-dependent dehydrogenase
MRAVAYQADGTLTVVDKPDPVAGRGQAVVAVERCGICGSDIHLRRSGMLGPGAVMGHEFAGTVVSAGEGEGVDDGRGLVGRRVAVLPFRRCGACPRCLEGRTALCVEGMAHGLGLGGLDGAFAEYVTVSSRSCHPVPAGMTADQGALVEPYAVALHGLRRSRVEPGSVVGVIGAGPIGLMTIAALRAAGVEAIVVAERSDTRAELAVALGAAAVAADAHQLSSAIGDDLDVVFECAGVPETPQIALELVRPGGQVVLVGVTNPDEPLTMVSFLWIIKEVDIAGSFAYDDVDYADAVIAVAGGAVDPALVVSEVRPLEDADASFDELLKPGGPIKLLLAP